MSNSLRSEDFLLSLVVPCYNEETVIQTTYDHICEALGNNKFRLQIVFINDGSKDATERILEDISASDPRVKIVTLARNFGHQAAVSAGLANADGDAVAVIDADLQDPPGVILEMIERWREGFDVVYGIRTKRKEAVWKRTCYSAFYRIFRWLSDIDAPLDAGDFSLIDKQVLRHVNGLPEKNRFFRGLRVWVGFKQTGICYQRQPRAAGKTKYSLLQLLRLAADGVFSFSTVPLTIVFILGLAMSIISMTSAFAVFAARIFDVPWLGGHLRDAQGFTSIILTVLLIGGIQLICTGILGEYIGRIYQEVKSRPSYIVQETKVDEVSRQIRVTGGLACDEENNIAKTVERIAGALDNPNMAPVRPKARGLGASWGEASRCEPGAPRTS
jgi:polyisoprenyl-phosphate glycosyltransferase